MIAMMKTVRKNRLRRALRSAGLRIVLAACLLHAVPVLAQEESVEHDARLDGYVENVIIDGDSTALTWLLLVLLGSIALAVMFKNARRTHLD
jgi:hypothetical protein